VPLLILEGSLLVGPPLQCKAIQINVALVMGESLELNPLNSLRLDCANVLSLADPHEVLVSLDC